MKSTNENGDSSWKVEELVVWRETGGIQMIEEEDSWNYHL